ncbi:MULTISPECIES: hypothetical protein [unclassified Devosia]|uniref:hypothetical protein n=1 Tax=unclassified Devosia TaxID=196773 RepID=UPI001ACE6AAF|nr:MULTISPECIES: hypothetical protein [unclassified Devosia]MBN9304130.1 hypothetical protein [Devosia sp.]
MKRLLSGAALLLALLLPTAPAVADQSSLCLPTSGVVSGLTIVTGANAALKALATSSAGSSAPGNDCTGAPVLGQPWLDTSGSNAVAKIFDGTQFEVQGTLDDGTGTWLPPIGGGAGTLASAATTDLWSIPQSYVVITGTTAITKLAGAGAVTGTLKTISFAGATTLTYDATQLILPGGRSIQTAVGDKALVVALGGGNAVVVSYTPAAGDVPTGHVDQYLLASCPANSIEPNGGTIGDASSGASIRANADTAPLYAAMWALDASVAPILTSSGGASTRGASAAADFAAHKRLTVPDARGYFLRSLDDGRGVDASRLLGSSQAFATSTSGVTASASSSASATSTFTGNALPPHSHSYTFTDDVNGAAGNNPNSSEATGSARTLFSSGVSAGTPTGSVSTSVTVTTSVGLSGAAETRPRNLAVLTCVHL